MGGSGSSGGCEGENLLPEGRALEIAATTHQVARNNLYGLIRVLGQETSGALSFSAEASAPRAATMRREITREEFAARMAERAEVPMSVWDGRVRLSIAGYQDKLAVYMEDERMFLVEGAFASTHILKPQPAGDRLPMLVANEHFCMQLARRLGLSVADVAILRLPDPVLVVERFDRHRQTKGIRRLHAATRIVRRIKPRSQTRRASRNGRPDHTCKDGQQCTKSRKLR